MVSTVDLDTGYRKQVRGGITDNQALLEFREVENRMCELTGRYGDGWLPCLCPPDPEVYKDRLQLIKEATKKARSYFCLIQLTLLAQILVLR